MLLMKSADKEFWESDIKCILWQLNCTFIDRKYEVVTFHHKSESSSSGDRVLIILAFSIVWPDQAVILVRYEDKIANGRCPPVGDWGLRSFFKERNKFTQFRRVVDIFRLDVWLLFPTD